MLFVDKIKEFISSYFYCNVINEKVFSDAEIQYKSFLGKESVFVPRFLLDIRQLMVLMKRGKNWYNQIFDLSIDLHMSIKCKRDARLEAIVNLFTGSLLRLIQGIKGGEEQNKYYNALRSIGFLLFRTLE